MMCRSQSVGWRKRGGGVVPQVGSGHAGQVQAQQGDARQGVGDFYEGPLIITALCLPLSNLKRQGIR